MHRPARAAGGGGGGRLAEVQRLSWSCIEHNVCAVVINPPDHHFAIQVDVDVNEKVAAEAGVSAMPTFQFYVVRCPTAHLEVGRHSQSWSRPQYQLAQLLSHAAWFAVQICASELCTTHHRLSNLMLNRQRATLQKGTKVEELVGASPDKLQQLIAKHAGPAPTQDS